MTDIIVKTTPSNLLEEKQKFFADKTYNPQFRYEHESTPEELCVWGKPKEHLYQHARKILESFSAPQKEKIPVTQEYVIEKVAEFNQRYQLPKPIAIYFSPQLVTRCRVSAGSIYFQLPLTYSKETLADLFRHELETHILRRLNHAKQSWGVAPFPDLVFRSTEEGLANLHTHLLRDEKKIFKTYRTYVAAYLAQHASFAEIFKTLTKLGMGEQTAWLTTTRTKRGITDTSKPGGLTKDICYLEGTLEVWDWIINRENDPRDLFLGRISTSQVAELKPESSTSGLYYPSFFDNMDQYREHIAEIGRVNYFEELIKEPYVTSPVRS